MVKRGEISIADRMMSGNGLTEKTGKQRQNTQDGE